MIPDPQALFVLFAWSWLRHLGGLGLILLGIADNSLVPLTGSMDVLTIYLAASHRGLWFYYTVMATLGAVLGGYITYSLASRGGKQALEHRLSKATAEKFYGRFDRWGFGAVAVPAILPPPFPIVPFLLAAGALQYPRRKFLAALSLGRGIRFTILGILGMIYGDSIVGFFAQYYKPALAILIGLAVLGSILSIAEYYHARRRAKAANRQKQSNQAA